MRKIRVPKTLVKWLTFYTDTNYIPDTNYIQCSPHYVLRSYIAAHNDCIHSDDAYHASCDLIKIYAVEYMNPLTKRVCSLIRTLLIRLQPYLTAEQHINCRRMWRSIDDTVYAQLY